MTTFILTVFSLTSAGGKKENRTERGWIIGNIYFYGWMKVEVLLATCSTVIVLLQLIKK